MSKMMLKMIADMAGVSTDEIVKTVSDFQGMAGKGIETLEIIDARLRRIESALNITGDLVITKQEGKDNGD